MRKNFLKIIIYIFFMTLMACNKKTESLELAICGSYAVPGMFCYELKGGTYSCNIIEKDSYGRILFEYTTKNIITDNKETAIVICQKYDSKYVYYYEDKCYLFSDNIQNDITSFKETNDWNKDLNDINMSKRKNNLTYDLYINHNSILEYKKIKYSYSKKLDIEVSQIQELCFIDIDSNGNELYWIKLVSENEKEEYYFGIIDCNYEVYLLKNTERKIDSDSLANFKIESGWEYN